MNAYIFIVWLIICNIFFTKIQNKRILLIIIIIPMFLSLATQVNIGTDYYAYVYSFLYPDAIKYYEIGYSILNKLLGEISNNPRILFVTVSLIQMTLMYNIVRILYVKNLVKNISMFFLCLCITGSFYMLMFNVLRNSIAILFFNLGILLILSYKKKLGLLLIVIGVTFHKSLIVIIFLMFIFKKLYFKVYSKKVLIFLAIMTTFLNIIEIIPKLSILAYNILPEYIPYRHYLISEHMQPYLKGNGINTYFFIFFYIFSIFFYKKEKKTIFYYNIGIISIIMRLFFSNIPIFYRFLDYFAIFETLVLYTMIKEMLKKKWGYLGIFVLLFYMITGIVTINRIIKHSKDTVYFKNDYTIK